VPSAAIYDCEGARLSKDERAFFRDADPWGFILFARHCESRENVRALCDELRDCVGRAGAPILIDQEGGRVARLKPPLFPAHPPMGAIGALWTKSEQDARDAARLNGFLLARMITELGVTVDCAPMLDVRQKDAHDIVGDRAASEDPDVVAALGRELMEGLLEGGALPVIKHIPGHGRARADSHHELPRVSASRDDLRAVDFKPFRALNDAPMGMTAHIVFEAYDPELPATLSPSVIRDVIRGEIGFDGLLMTDDLKMKALKLPLEHRAEAALKAGCDIALCCNFSLAEKVAAARGVDRTRCRAWSTRARSSQTEHCRPSGRLSTIGGIDRRRRLRGWPKR
jgi:beta-N-acetylhexosaminidase